MPEADQTKEQLAAEVQALRQQIETLQTAMATQQRQHGAPAVAHPTTRAMIEAVREPLLVLDAALRVQAANHAFYQTFQLQPADTEQQELFALGTQQWNIPELGRRLKTLLFQRLPVDDFEVNQDFIPLGRKVLLLTARCIESEAGDSPLILLAIKDVTEQRRMERLARQRSEWVTVTLASIGDAVIATDITGAETFMNPVAEQLTGWLAQEALGCEAEDVLVLVDQETRRAVENPIRRVLRDGVIVELFRPTLLLSRDGREIPVADTGAPIRSNGGEPSGVVMILRDVSKQYQVEQALRVAKEAAEAADQTKSEFLATMSHELRTPLSIITGYTDLMREGAFGLITPEANETLRRVQHHAAEVLDLITAMLDLSRLEAGRLPVHVQEVWIPTLLEELKAETQEICERAELEVAWHAEATLPSLYTDTGKLKVVVKNLLGNAVKFIPQGRITVQAQRHHDGGVEFCVADTGIGIPRDALAVIFEPFQQVEGDGWGSQHGTGLGLHIVKRLMELLGGTVAVESEVGKGSTFRVWVPSGDTPASRIETAL